MLNAATKKQLEQRVSFETSIISGIVSL
jgi:hypothetical protein